MPTIPRKRPELDCSTGTFTETDGRIAAPRAKVTDRAGRWVTAQVGRDGRSVAEVARELGCDWHTVMDAVSAYGSPLIDHADRIAEVAALGLDETLFARRGPKKTRSWCTSIVDVDRPAQLLDVVEGRTAKAPTDWLEARADEWRAGISWGVLDLSGPYRKTFTDTLPAATQVADPFHVIKLANSRGFAHMSALGDPAPIVVWVRVGNTRRAPLLAWFEPLIDRIAVMVEAGDRVIKLR